MSKALRLSEKWFRRGLWLVAVVFASFLIGLGGTIVGDLPKVERPLQVDDFLDKAQARALRDFLDLFNHRLVSLLYRARKKYRPALDPGAPGRGRIATVLLAEGLDAA